MGRCRRSLDVRRCTAICAVAVVLPAVAVAQSGPWERQAEREVMVERYLEGQGITSSRVLEAMRAVPRHRFVPDDEQRAAYENRPLPIGNGQTISQPYVVAYMTQELDLRPGDAVLEIGTGSGYQAAILAEITENVYTVEIIPSLGHRAREVLDDLGYDSVKTKVGDGYFGWPEHAPYRGIIVTAAADHVPPPLIDQLAPGGMIIIPVGSPYQVQTLMKITKSEGGQVSREPLLPVRFVPFTRSQ